MTIAPRTTLTQSPSTDCSRMRLSPSYYDREQGVPQRWVELMKRSMKSTLVAFSTQRMVEEYAELAYLKVGGERVSVPESVLSTQQHLPRGLAPSSAR